MDIELQTIRSGFDGQKCWVGPWCGIADDGRTAVLTMQQLLLSGSDVFFGAYSARSDDRGRTFSALTPVPSMGRRPEGENMESCVNDLKPERHSASGSMLGIGTRVFYRDAEVPDHVRTGGRSPETVYSVWHPTRDDWSDPVTLSMPDRSEYEHSVAGSVQRLECADGSILLPIACKQSDSRIRQTVVAECRFDGTHLEVKRLGNALNVPEPRGLVEPSITRVGDRYMLTMRNDQAGYVAVSSDGLNFEGLQRWRFDDGEELGNYNTQQHWVTHDNRVWLVYTRRGLNNDHVFRNRAPLMIAEVDPDELVVIRKTEQVLIPERGARLGNFGVTYVDEKETWITVAEWMQPVGCEKYGSDNSVYLARITWS